MRSLILIPTYNERENLPVIVKQVRSVAPSAEVLVIDDNSPDGTGKLADECAVADSKIHVLHRAGKQGLGRAYVAGFEWGLKNGFDALIQMDADFSHDPKYLPTMLATLESGADVAIGSRYVAGGGTVNWGPTRKIVSRGGSLYSRLILGAPIRDFTGGFNGWKGAVLRALDLSALRSDGYSFQIELKYRAFKAGFTLKEFPIVFADRKVGQSKMSPRIVFEALARVWQFRFSNI